MGGKKVGYYIYYETNTDFVGVKKKIDNQVAVLNTYVDCKKIIVPREKKNIIRSILWRLPFGSFGRKYEYALDILEKNQQPDFVYVRFVPVDRRFLRFIAYLRNRYPETKILLEVATYPYGKELLADFTMIPFFFKDLVYHKRLKKYVDRIITFSDDNDIWKIPTIKTMNGINVQDVKVIHPILHPKDEIHLIGVAVLRKPHGFERLMEGMWRYYSCDDEKNFRKIIFHIVGDGPEKKKYEKIVQKYSLSNNIIFHGMLVGEKLDEVYNQCDLAVASLGFYKLNINYISTLKTREYLAKGLPIIYGCRDSALSKDYPFSLEVTNDSKPINMKDVIQFFDDIYGGLYGDKENIINSIREYAEKRVNMDKVMQPIIQYIESGTSRERNKERL